MKSDKSQTVTLSGDRWDNRPKTWTNMQDLATVAMAIRLGMGALFIAGGWNKLSKLLFPGSSEQLVASYTSTTGYINEFFMVWMFGSESILTPWAFLTTLSAFELITGIMLVAGLLVRPIALIYAFLLWSFVIALPVVTTNGVDPGVKTYMAPAILVQMRDVALSGMMFALYGLGSGHASLDRRLFGDAALKPLIEWETAGVLLRLSLASVFLVGGAFAGMPNIKSFLEPGVILVAIGAALLWGGSISRYAAMAACAVLLIYIFNKIGVSKGLIGSLNAVKREIAIFAVALVISLRGSGMLWSIPDVWQRIRSGMHAAQENMTKTPKASGQST